MGCLCYVNVNTPGGLLGYKRDGGGGGGGPMEPNILHPKKNMDLILCTQKKTRLDILDPKKYMIGLNCVRTVSLAEIRTHKNTRRFFRPKKIQELTILDPKKYVGPPRHVYTPGLIPPTVCSRYLFIHLGRKRDNRCDYTSHFTLG